MDSDKENIYLHPNTGLKNRAARRMANNLRDTSCNDLPSQQSEFGAQLTSLGYSIQPHLLNQSLPSNTSSTVNSSSDAALIALAKLSQMVETVSPTSSNTAFTHSEHYHSSSIEALSELPCNILLTGVNMAGFFNLYVVYDTSPCIMLKRIIVHQVCMITSI